MTMAFGWEHVTSGLGALAVMLMGYQIRRIGKIEDKLDQKVNEKTCKERHDAFCAKIEKLEAEDDKLWNALNDHNHVGLENGRVIR